MNNLVLSTLGHTWILDLDGTVVKHNGYKIDGMDSFLPGAKDLLNHIPEKDMIILLTSRSEQYRQQTVAFLRSNNIRFNYIIFDVPYGERILINDRKLSGLTTAISISIDRDSECTISFTEDADL